MQFNALQIKFREDLLVKVINSFEHATGIVENVAIEIPRAKWERAAINRRA
jgi:hypothetical protein